MRKHQLYEVVIHSDEMAESDSMQMRVEKWYENLIAETLKQSNLCAEKKNELLRSIR